MDDRYSFRSITYFRNKMHISLFLIIIFLYSAATHMAVKNYRAIHQEVFPWAYQQCNLRKDVFISQNELSYAAGTNNTPNLSFLRRKEKRKQLQNPLSYPCFISVVG
jgi:hypothetical protein